MSYPPLTPRPPRMEDDLNLLEWSATAEPPDAAEWTDRRRYKIAVVSEPRRGGKTYWRTRAEEAERRLDAVREIVRDVATDAGDGKGTR